MILRLTEYINPRYFNENVSINSDRLPKPSRRKIICGCQDETCEHPNHHGKLIISLWDGEELCEEVLSRARNERRRYDELINDYMKKKQSSNTMVFNEEIKRLKQVSSIWDMISNIFSEQITNEDDRNELENFENFILNIYC